MAHSAPWNDTLKHQASFPARLDDEYSMVSILRHVPAQDLIDQPLVQKTVAIRLVLRHQRTNNAPWSTQDVLDYRLEFLDLPGAYDPGLCYTLCPGYFLTIETLATQVHVISSENNPIVIAGNDKRITQDPGDLPGVMVSDGEIHKAPLDHLRTLPRHHLMAIFANPDIEVFRIP